MGAKNPFDGTEQAVTFLRASQHDVTSFFGTKVLIIIEGQFLSTVLRTAKIDKLRKRYEIITMSMQTPEGEEEHSQAYHVITAAQEKEALQQQIEQSAEVVENQKKEIENKAIEMRNRISQQETEIKNLNQHCYIFLP